MSNQPISITLDFTRDIAQLAELTSMHATAPEAARVSIGNAITSLAQVICKKAQLQREVLDKTLVPGPLSPERLNRDDFNVLGTATGRMPMKSVGDTGSPE